jgi:putative beta-lysine N-acetyltransferase
MNELTEEMKIQMKNSIKSKISHGGGSNRVYLMHLHHDDFPEIINHIGSIVQQFNYTKVFAKVPAHYAPVFFSNGYIVEASIPCFFNGKEDVLFLAKYNSDERHKPDIESLQEFQNMFILPPSVSKTQLDTNFMIRQLTTDDIAAMIEVFKQVFETYPFPIFEPGFLVQSMEKDGTRYFGVFLENKLIAVSSAECSNTEMNAEMTDFAVLPEFRGKRLASHLLSFMEKELAKSDFKTFYTISRLKSISMNKTFYNAGYKYSGTLTQNTQISGNIESMNVWYKNISK